MNDERAMPYVTVANSALRNSQKIATLFAMA
jgi:hypothetical protein